MWLRIETAEELKSPLNHLPSLYGWGSMSAQLVGTFLLPMSCRWPPAGQTAKEKQTFQLISTLQQTDKHQSIKQICIEYLLCWGLSTKHRGYKRGVQFLFLKNICVNWGRERECTNILQYLYNFNDISFIPHIKLMN